MPAWLPRGGGHRRLTQARGHPRQAHRSLGLAVPREPLRHHGGFERVKADPTGVAGTRGLQDVARGGHTPRQEWSTAERGVPAPSPAIGTQGAFVLGHRPAPLQQELIVGILTHRTIQALDLTPPLGACLDEEPLRHRVAREAIRGGAEHPREGRTGGPIPPPIHAGPVERRPTGAVIALEVLLGEVPIRRGRDVDAQTIELVGHRLGVLVARGGDTDRASDFHTVPPEERMTQATRLRRGPWSIAEGTGTHNPTVSHRHSVPGPSGAHASVFS